MTPTEQYIRALARLGPGALGLLRTQAGQGLNETVAGLDLFTGLWWPLRQQDQRAPRREVAWLVMKLYAFRPMKPSRGDTLARQLGRCQPRDDQLYKRYLQRVDTLMHLPLTRIETALQWALDEVADGSGRLDWMSLTDDLSAWEREATRECWAAQYLEAEGDKPC